MRYIPDHYDEKEPCDDCGAFTRGMVVHDDGAEADVENGPSADEVPTMHPLCSVCWASWSEDEEAQRRESMGGEDAHLEAAYEDRHILSGGEDWF